MIICLFLALDPALLSLSLTYIIYLTDLFSYFLRVGTNVESLVRTQEIHLYFFTRV